MFDSIRYQIALYYAKKTEREMVKGNFEAMRKGLKYLKKSVLIVPPSPELREFGKKMSEVVELHDPKKKN